MDWQLGNILKAGVKSPISPDVSSNRPWLNFNPIHHYLTFGYFTSAFGGVRLASCRLIGYLEDSLWLSWPSFFSWALRLWIFGFRASWNRENTISFILDLYKDGSPFWAWAARYPWTVRYRYIGGILINEKSKQGNICKQLFQEHWQIFVLASPQTLQFIIVTMWLILGTCL